MRRTRPVFLSLLAFALTACGGGGGGGAASIRNNADLAALVFSAGALTPAFHPTVFVYTATVASTVDKATFTPTSADVLSAVTVNGQPVASGSTSAAQGLVEGSNDIAISVTAADAVTVKTYTVTVTRHPAPVLTNLSLSVGSMSPAFGPATTAYTAAVGFLDGSIRVTPAATIPGATLTVNGTAVGSGLPSPPIALAAGANTITVRVTNAGGELLDYFLTVTRAAATQFAQEAYVKASNSDAHDQFGWTVALSGDTLAVAVGSEDSNATGVNGNQADNSAPNAGAVYVFTRSGATWAQQAYIKASNTNAEDQFGFSVALSGDTLAVGARYEDSSSTGIDGNQASNGSLESGAVYVFTRVGTTWTQQAYIKASNTGADDEFGQSVSLSGDTLAVGASDEGSSATGVGGNQADNGAQSSGAVYVFTRVGGTWSQQAYLKASNTGRFDRFGWHVSLSGDTLAVSAPGEDSRATGIDGNQSDDSAPDSGAVYVFLRSGSVWAQQAYVKASNTDAGDTFGWRLSLSGDTLAVGAYLEDSAATGVNANQADNSAPDAGAVYVFVRGGTAWAQQAYVKASNANAEDNLGFSLALSGDTLAIGAQAEASAATGLNGNQSDNTARRAGAVYVFSRAGTSWTQEAYVKASNTGAFDNFGTSVAVGGDTLVVGALGEASNATGINGNQTNNSAPDAGAVYVRR